MKTNFLFLILGISLISACKDEDPVNATGIEGEWAWVQSYGGFGGETITPQTEGFSKHLEIDSDMYREYQNDSLIFIAEYNIETRQDSFFGTNKVIAFDTGYELAIIQEGDDLRLIEICFDCYEHTYVRE